MNATDQSVEQVVNAMAGVLAKHLDPDQINKLSKSWRRYPQISVKMLQQCVLDTTTHYPHLKPYKSEIRKGFWSVMQGNEPDGLETGEDRGHERGDRSEQLSSSEIVEAFYTIIEAIQKQLSAPDGRALFQQLHQVVVTERTLKGHSINMQQFLNDERPQVPDNEKVLNNLVQLVYVCLCDLLGPVEADETLYQSAEIAKQSHAKTIVEKLF